MPSDPPAVALFNTEKGIGGMQVLVVRMARELHALGVQCVVFDSAGEFVSEELRKSDLPCMQVHQSAKQKKLDTFLPKGCILVALNTQPSIIAQLLEQRTRRLLIWDVFPPYWLNGYLSPDIPFVRGWIKRSRWLPLARQRHATYLMESSGVVFMDETGVENMQLLTRRKWPDASVVPLPIEAASLPRKMRYLGGGPISCFYIGRAVLWKVKPLRRLLQDFGCDRDVHWTVVTDSASKFWSLLGLTVAGKLEVCENVIGANLSNLILRNADICFAMGTSCLEGARLGVPSVLVDFATDQQEMPPEYGYRWLYEEIGYCLGRDVGHVASVPGMTAAAVISNFRANGEIIGQLCWDAARGKFAAPTVAKNLLRAAQKTRLTMSGYTKAPIYKLAWLGWFLQHARSTWKWRRCGGA
jgi:hypothetical protein